jgi:hypothetical protein
MLSGNVAAPSSRCAAREAEEVKDLERRLFDGAVHSFGLTIGPRMIRLSELMLDAILTADAIEDVSKPPGCWTLPILGEIGESRAVVGEHGMDPVGKGSNDVAEEGRAVHLTGFLIEFDIGEFRNAVDRENILSLPSARRSSQMSIWTKPIVVSAKRPRFEVFSSLSGRRDMPFAHQTTMEAGAGQSRDAVLQASENIVEWQECPATELDYHRFLD